jgi:membrane associated rhomboid family serine protease
MLPLPIGDITKTRSFPYVNVTLIALNVLVFLLTIGQGADGYRLFTLAFGNIPYEIVTGRDLPPTIAPFPVYITFLTAMFMHGGWLHLLGNMLYLWVFGDNVEDSMGHGKYLVFYLLCGVLASLTHIFFNIDSRIPAVGASGAISGMLGAYFVLHPNGPIRTLFIILLFIRVIYLPAWVLLGLYFLLQVAQATFGGPDSGVAVWAHIGGFVAGMVLIFLFRDPRRGPAAQIDWRAGRGYS